MHGLEIVTVLSLVMMISTVAKSAAVSGKCHIIILVANTKPYPVCSTSKVLCLDVYLILRCVYQELRSVSV